MRRLASFGVRATVAGSLLACVAARAPGNHQIAVAGTPWDSAIVATAELAVSAASVIDRAWPGFWSPPAFAIFRPDTAIYLFTADSVPIGFKRIFDPRLPASLRTSWYVLEGSSRGLQGGAIPIDPNAARLVMAVELSEGPTSPLEFLLHESFHGWQFRNFSELFDFSIPQQLPDSLHFPATLRARLDVERQLLVAAVEERSYDTQRALVRDYLSARRLRLSESPDIARRIERIAERREGTAEYVGLAGTMAARRLGKDIVRDSIASRIRSEMYWGPAMLSPRAHLSSRAYRTGSAMALLLDHQSCGVWRPQVSRGAFLDILLSRCVGLPIEGF